MALFSNFLNIAVGNKTNGFYIECGAADGEEGTNTLYFEINRNWKGNYLLTLSFNIPFMNRNCTIPNLYDRLNITIILGLLIEPNKNTFRKLLNKNRNAIHINSCLSNTKKPQKVEFINPDMDQLGGVVGDFHFLASYWIKLLLNFCDFEKIRPI